MLMSASDATQPDMVKKSCPKIKNVSKFFCVGHGKEDQNFLPFQNKHNC